MNPSGLGNLLASNPSSLGNLLSSNPSGFGSLLASNPSGLGNLLASNPSGLGNLLGSNPSGLGSLLSSDPSGLGNLLSSNPSGLGNLLASNPSGLGDLLASNPSSLGSLLASDPSLIDTLFTNDPALLSQFLSSNPSILTTFALDLTRLNVNLSGTSGNQVTGGLLANYDIGTGSVFTENITAGQLDLLNQGLAQGVAASIYDLNVTANGGNNTLVGGLMGNFTANGGGNNRFVIEDRQLPGDRSGHRPPGRSRQFRRHLHRQRRQRHLLLPRRQLGLQLRQCDPRRNRRCGDHRYPRLLQLPGRRSQPGPGTGPACKRWSRTATAPPAWR